VSRTSTLAIALRALVRDMRFMPRSRACPESWSRRFQP
jgi:hypothetical protein